MYCGEARWALSSGMFFSGAPVSTQRMSRLVKEAMSRRASQSGAVASSEKPLREGLRQECMQKPARAGAGISMGICDAGLEGAGVTACSRSS